MSDHEATYTHTLALSGVYPAVENVLRVHGVAGRDTEDAVRLLTAAAESAGVPIPARCFAALFPARPSHSRLPRTEFNGVCSDPVTLAAALGSARQPRNPPITVRWSPAAQVGRLEERARMSQVPARAWICEWCSRRCWCPASETEWQDIAYTGCMGSECVLGPLHPCTGYTRPGVGWEECSVSPEDELVWDETQANALESQWKQHLLMRAERRDAWMVGSVLLPLPSGAHLVSSDYDEAVIWAAVAHAQRQLSRQDPRPAAHRLCALAQTRHFIADDDVGNAIAGVVHDESAPHTAIAEEWAEDGAPLIDGWMGSGIAADDLHTAHVHSVRSLLDKVREAAGSVEDGTPARIPATTAARVSPCAAHADATSRAHGAFALMCAEGGGGVVDPGTTVLTQAASIVNARRAYAASGDADRAPSDVPAQDDATPPHAEAVPPSDVYDGSNTEWPAMDIAVCSDLEYDLRRLFSAGVRAPEYWRWWTGCKSADVADARDEGHATGWPDDVIYAAARASLLGYSPPSMVMQDTTAFTNDVHLRIVACTQPDSNPWVPFQDDEDARAVFEWVNSMEDRSSYSIQRPFRWLRAYALSALRDRVDVSPLWIAAILCGVRSAGVQTRRGGVFDISLAHSAASPENTPQEPAVALLLLNASGLRANHRPTADYLSRWLDRHPVTESNKYTYYAEPAVQNAVRSARCMERALASADLSPQTRWALTEPSLIEAVVARLSVAAQPFPARGPAHTGPATRLGLLHPASHAAHARWTWTVHTRNRRCAGDIAEWLTDAAELVGGDPVMGAAEARLLQPDDDDDDVNV